MSPATSPARQRGLLQRKRDFVRAQASAAVWPLVLARGFEKITVEEMAAAAGLARRSFFRYFDSKEDALFVSVDAFGQLIAASIDERPRNEPIWDAISNGVAEVLAASPDNDGAKRVSRLLYESPALRARHLDKQDRWRTMLAERVERRLSGARSSHRARLLASLALTALDAAFIEWNHSRQPLATLARKAFDEARPALANSSEAPGSGSRR